MIAPQPLFVVPNRAERDAALRMSGVLGLNAKVVIAGESTVGIRASCVMILGVPQIANAMGAGNYLALRHALMNQIVPQGGHDAWQLVFEF